MQHYHENRHQPERTAQEITETGQGLMINDCQIANKPFKYIFHGG